MTDPLQLLTDAETHLKATTVSYPTYLKNLKAGKYPDPTKTEWGALLLDLDTAIASLQPTPTPTPTTAFGAKLPARMPQSHGHTLEVTSVADFWKAYATAVSGDTIIVDDGLEFRATKSFNPIDGAAMGLTRKFDLNNPVTIKTKTRYGSKITAGSQKSDPYYYGLSFYKAAGHRVVGFSIQDVHGNDGDGSGSAGMYMNGVNGIEVMNYRQVNIGGQGLTIVGDPSDSQSPVSKNVWLINGWYEQIGVDTSGGYYDTRGTHGMYVGQSQSIYDRAGGVDGLVVANHVFYGAFPGYGIEPGPQARRVFVVNSTFVDNYSVHPWARDFINYYSDATNAYSTQGARVHNAIFSGTAGSCIDGSGGVGAIDAKVSHSIFDRIGINQDGSSAGQEPFATIHYVDENGNTLTHAQVIANNKGADPKFVDHANKKFQLAAGSPGIGYADPDWCLPFDFNEKLRTSADVGAFAV